MGAEGVVDLRSGDGGARSVLPCRPGQALAAPGRCRFGRRCFVQGFIVQQRLDGLGASVNAATSKETTHIHARFLDEHTEEVFDLLAEMLLAPTYPEIDSEREVVLEEIAMYEDEPQDRVHDVLAAAVFGEHPLGRRVLGEAEAVDGTGRVHRLDADELGFAYRTTRTPEDWIFTRAVLEGCRGERERIERRMHEIQSARQETQPVRTRTGGSTFKNPPGCSAWKLIEAAGCRGLRRGGAMVSEMHCNFLLNTGDATAADLEGLGEEVRVIKGTIDGPVTVEDNGARFFADVLEGQKTGWFFDQRDNRAVVARLASGARVLDAYAYLGGFGITAARAGAQTWASCRLITRTFLISLLANSRTTGLITSISPLP